MVALEVWNEPNLPRFFAPGPVAGALLPPAQQRQGGPLRRRPAPIITGGLAAGTAATGGGDPGAPLPEPASTGSPGKASFDGIGAHPYPKGAIRYAVSRFGSNMNLAPPDSVRGGLQM